jgi:hypothetical protein
MDSNKNIRDGVSVKQIEEAFLQYLEADPAEENSAAWFASGRILRCSRINL